MFWCHWASCTGCAIKARNCATPLYSAGVRFGAVMVHRLAPPMIELIGALVSSGSYGSGASSQRNLAFFAMSARPPDELKQIAASPE